MCGRRQGCLLLVGRQTRAAHDGAGVLACKRLHTEEVISMLLSVAAVCSSDRIVGWGSCGGSFLSARGQTMMS